METIKNVMQLLVAKDIASSSNEGSLATTSTVADGEVVACDRKNTILDAASLPSGLDAFKFVANVGGVLIHSDLVEKGKVRKYELGLQSAEVQQVDYVGYNGTSGSITPLTADLVYTVRLYVLGVTKADFMQQMIKEGFYKAGSTTPTQKAVASGLQLSLIKNFSREPEQRILFEMVADGTRTALGTAAGDVTFTNGSKIISATDIDDATTNAALAVGELIGVATGTTVGVYEIASIDTTANTATLTVPFQGATATVANATVGRVTVANQTNFGLKLTGLDLTFVLGKFKSNVVSWDTTVDFDSTVDENVAAYPGIGTYPQVASLEKELQADEYVFRMFIEGAPVDRAQAASGNLYDMCLLEYDGVIQSGGGTLDVKSPKQLMIALENNTALGDDANGGIITFLNALFGASGAWEVLGADKTPTA